MPDKGFGADLWKNVQAIRLGKDGGIEAPVRANGRDGIVVGVDRVAEADARTHDAATPSSPGFVRRLLKRLRRRR
jgi:hypothetical protein